MVEIIVTRRIPSFVFVLKARFVPFTFTFRTKTSWMDDWGFLRLPRGRRKVWACAIVRLSLEKCFAQEIGLGKVISVYGWLGKIW